MSGCQLQQPGIDGLVAESILWFAGTRGRSGGRVFLMHVSEARHRRYASIRD
jgi:hypothetical protein